METQPTSPSINNSFYNDLGDRWYQAWDDPVALLRAEGKLKDPWVAEQIRKAFPTSPAQVLDIGCGAGFLANALSVQGHKVIGLDLSPASLKTAQNHDATKRTKFQIANAYHLPFRSSTFDIVTTMDFLEHIERPEQVIREAARVLKPGGRLFFHTFNRNWIAWLIVIKGLEWFVKNTPKHMHVLPLFIKPAELKNLCEKNHMSILELKGIRPEIGRTAFWKLLLTRQVPKDFQFRFTPSLTLAYLGQAQKDSSP